MKLKFQDILYKDNSKKSSNQIQNLSFKLCNGEHLSLLTSHENKAQTIIDLIVGTIKPTKGKIIRNGSMSGPLGAYNWFHGAMTCRENIHFICELYGKNSYKICNDISEFIEHSVNLKHKFGELKLDEKRKIALTLSLHLDLDIYLTKRGTGHPDKNFQKKIETRFEELINSTATLITVSTDIKFLRKYFKHAIFVDKNGISEYFPNLNDAIDTYKAANKQPRN